MSNLAIANITNTSKGHSIALKEPSVLVTKSTEERDELGERRTRSQLPVLSKLSSLRVGSVLRVWAEVSKINYLSTSQPYLASAHSTIWRRSTCIPSDFSLEKILPPLLKSKSIEQLLTEKFPINVTPLLNEDQYWGCFYNFPELYEDVYSPLVKIRELQDVPELVGGVLTRDMVTACLSYLRRNPILGDFVLIKLDLSSKFLVDINVLEHYKYLVYLDLSSNLLTELSVLSYLLYLQYLSVAFNRLCTVLEYDTPQWFLTEVHYKFNSVKRIRDLAMFWSITVLDLSHNNIKGISGLESLRYLRRLDLSFNHIQRIENLNHLRLVWLDLSYNNISSFEFGPEFGLWTLLHLEFLNLNENNLTSMKIFSGCIRLRELHARNNRLSMLLELAVYMRQMRNLGILDLRANPICSVLGYKDVVINTFPILLRLDDELLDPVEQRTAKMEMTPQVDKFASHRLLRLLYVEQLARAKVSSCVPPADTTEVPIVVLVGYEAVGKGKLARRLAETCGDHIALAVQHTTAQYHMPGHYKQVSRQKFDDMVLAGEFLTYTEVDGESYGLSREESFIKDGKVRVACMDLISALMLKQRGRRPCMILCYGKDKMELLRRQQARKISRNTANEQRLSLVTPMNRSTLQVMLSGRIIITGILNEILLCLPEDKEKSEFMMESECSLMMDSEARQAMQEYARGVNLLTLLAASSTSLEEACKRAHEKSSQVEPSLYSLYKESQGTGEYNSYANGQNSYQERKTKKLSSEHIEGQRTKEKQSSLSQPKSVDFSRYASSTWRDRLSNVPDGSKSSKSVTFTATEEGNQEIDTSGMLLDPQISPTEEDQDKHEKLRSISTRLPWSTRGQSRVASGGSADDLDLWLAFLTETGITQASDLFNDTSDQSHLGRRDTTESKIDDPNMLIREMNYYVQTLHETFTKTIRDDYEGIHRLCPGLFYDTVAMDNAEEAFSKTKKLIRDIVNSQSVLKPMFDIDFANLDGYPTVQQRLSDICDQIAPQRLFH